MNMAGGRRDAINNFFFNFFSLIYYHYFLGSCIMRFMFLYLPTQYANQSHISKILLDQRWSYSQEAGSGLVTKILQSITGTQMHTRTTTHGSNCWLIYVDP